MTVLTEPQQETKERTIRDIICIVDGIMDDAPTFTGQLEVHVKDGVAVDIYARRKYRVFDEKN